MIFYIYVGLFGSYILFKVILQRHTLFTLGCKIAVPSSTNPFEFFILEELDDGIKTYQYHLLKKQMKNPEYFDFPPKKYKHMARKSSVFNDISRITKFLHITNISEDEQGTTIIARDLGVRNFGGKFGTTTIRFDRQGELVDEVANI